MQQWAEWMGDTNIDPDKEPPRENAATELLRVMCASGELDSASGVLVVSLHDGGTNLHWKHAGLNEAERVGIVSRLSRYLGG